jgi:hypothetical protein
MQCLEFGRSFTLVVKEIVHFLLGIGYVIRASGHLDDAFRCHVDGKPPLVGYRLKGVSRVCGIAEIAL